MHSFDLLPCLYLQAKFIPNTYVFKQCTIPNLIKDDFVH